MILLHIGFRYLENCLLSKSDNSPTISNVSTRRLKLQLQNHLYGWVSQGHRSWITKFPSHSPVHLLSSMWGWSQARSLNHKIISGQTRQALVSAETARFTPQLDQIQLRTSADGISTNEKLNFSCGFLALQTSGTLESSLQQPTLFHSESHN